MDLSPAHTYQRLEEAGPDLHTLGPGEACVFTARAPDKETLNEDAASLIPIDDETAVLVVADGAGGLPAGDDASAKAVECMVRAVQEAAAERSSLRAAILNGIEQANREILALGSGAGTTLAIAEIRPDHVRTFHVGDSLILLTGQRGRIKLQTIAHSPVGYGLESGLLDEDEAINHEERHLVSNLVGMPEMRIEIGPRLALAARDTLVLASDGLLDNLPVDEVVELARKGPLPEATRKLGEACRARMGEGHPDDLMLVLFRLRVAPRAKPDEAEQVEESSGEQQMLFEG